jgi:DNA helicase-2/ATP-dependent DNA helicase PcrA
VEAIYLEENYRSTGAILAAAHSVVTQGKSARVVARNSCANMADRTRIQKSLYTSHPKSTTVSLKNFSTPIIESSFIATEIKRLIAYSGGVLGYEDFAILCE